MTIKNLDLRLNSGTFLDDDISDTIVARPRTLRRWFFFSGVLFFHNLFEVGWATGTVAWNAIPILPDVGTKNGGLGIVGLRFSVTTMILIYYISYI